MDHKSTVANNEQIVLSLQSERLEEAVYFCGWEDGNKNFIKSTGFILLRSQTPLRLTVGKFAVVSLETWLQVSMDTRILSQANIH